MAKCPYRDPLSGDCKTELSLSVSCYGEINSCDSCIPDNADPELLYLKMKIQQLEALLVSNDIPLEPFKD